MYVQITLIKGLFIVYLHVNIEEVCLNSITKFGIRT